MWELATWQLPFERAGLNSFQIISLKQRGEGPCLEPPPEDALPAGPLSCYARYCSLMAACLARHPAARPSFEDCVQQLG